MFKNGIIYIGKIDIDSTMLAGLHKLFWSTSAKKLDKREDKKLIIHQTLAYGSLADIRRLNQIYSKAEVKKVFLNGKRGMYDPRVLALLKVMYGIKKLDSKKYVKKIY